MPHCAAASQQPVFSYSSSAVTAQAPPASAWNGKGTQEEFMYKDECILVDEKDCIIGHASKYDTHRFTVPQPKGRLHRAFSVFLFNSHNQLLLQQRASTKITFPKVWTNTCCSHPLHGYNPGEVDDSSAVASGAVMGAKRAAVRKLGHELGIPAEQLSIDSFKFLTRLHYCASDDGTYGPQAEWGEHEIDYILFVKADVHLAPNPEEVDAVKYVTFQELTSMMQSSSGLLWSPWFRILATHFLEGWWQDVDKTIKTDMHVDLHTIHNI
ncbi:hypothetical protein ABBQ38_003600 [Trebouxia sp. C0009 RCD-2024]